MARLLVHFVFSVFTENTFLARRKILGG
jgi:hypothetical protein